MPCASMVYGGSYLNTAQMPWALPITSPNARPQVCSTQRSSSTRTTSRPRSPLGGSSPGASHAAKRRPAAPYRMRQLTSHPICMLLSASSDSLRPTDPQAGESVGAAHIRGTPHAPPAQPPPARRLAASATASRAAQLHRCRCRSRRRLPCSLAPGCVFSLPPAPARLWQVVYAHGTGRGQPPHRRWRDELPGTYR